MESIRLQEEKQVKAREQRERLLEEKLQKIKEIEKKVIYYIFSLYKMLFSLSSFCS